MNAVSVGRLALGTVQFGRAYGVSNKRGQVPKAEVAGLLSTALSLGMRVLDTAMAYGESEQVLGTVGVDEWKVVTKLPPATETGNHGGAVTRSVAAARERLRLPRLYGVLLHRAADLLAPDGDSLYASLRRERDAGTVERIGVSIYDPGELDLLWPRFELDLVQAPLNVFDQRLVRSGTLDRLAERGVAVHVRSVFLQGLLLIPPDRRPKYFARWAPAFECWERWCGEVGYSRLEGCLAAVMGDARIEAVIVGVEGTAQLQEIAQAVSRLRDWAPESLALSDRDLLEPSRWELA